MRRLNISYVSISSSLSLNLYILFFQVLLLNRVALYFQRLFSTLYFLVFVLILSLPSSPLAACWLHCLLCETRLEPSEIQRSLDKDKARLFEKRRLKALFAFDIPVFVSNQDWKYITRKARTFFRTTHLIQRWNKEKTALNHLPVTVFELSILSHLAHNCNASHKTKCTQK